VRAAAVSILRQRFRDLRLVAVDDGSTDATASILDDLAARDRRVLVVRGPGEGIAAALNRGLQRVDAPVVARMDADDVATPDRLERQLGALAEDRRLAAVGSRVRLFPRREVREGMRRYAAWLNALTTPEELERDLLVEAPIVHPAAALRTASLRAVGGWRDGPFPEDYDLWLRLAAGGGLLANLPHTLLAWRESAGRLTRQDPRYRLDRHVALKCAHLAAHWLAGRGEVALWGAGDTGKAFADALSAHGIAVALFIDVKRGRIGGRKRGAPVLGPDQVGRARGLPLLVAVGAAGARPLIRAELARQGFSEPGDYRVVS
jgi:GT2 family glycosyltransferase